MALTGVLRPGHVSIRVLELEPAVKHYRDVLGLIEVARDAQNRVYLKGWDEQDHSSIILREAGPVKGGTTVIAFVQDPDGYKIELIERADGAGGTGL